MANSSQITDRILRDPNPAEAKAKIWAATRYLVAQKPAADNYSTTTEGYYKGKVVIPGPKANPKYGVIADVQDLDLMEQRHYIRFFDTATTEGAQADIGQALYTIMTSQEADEYEAVLEQEWKDRKAGKIL